MNFGYAAMTWAVQFAGAHNDVIAFVLTAVLLAGYQGFLRVKLLVLLVVLYKLDRAPRVLEGDYA